MSCFFSSSSFFPLNKDCFSAWGIVGSSTHGHFIERNLHMCTHEWQQFKMETVNTNTTSGFHSSSSSSSSSKCMYERNVINLLSTNTVTQSIRVSFMRSEMTDDWGNVHYLFLLLLLLWYLHTSIEMNRIPHSETLKTKRSKRLPVPSTRQLELEGKPLA